MNITEEVLLDIGFINKGTIDNETRQLYEIYIDGIGFLALITDIDSDIHYLYFHKDKDDKNFNIISRVTSLSKLVEAMSQSIKIESIKLGKKLKQEEFKTVLGI